MACAEKEDYIKLAFETQHQPILPPVDTSTVEAAEKADLNKKEVDDVSPMMRGRK